MEQSKLQLWKKQMIGNAWTSIVFLQPFGVRVCVSSPSRKVIKGKHVLCDAYRLTGYQPVMELEDCPNSIGRIQSRIALLERSMSRKQQKMSTGNMHKKNHSVSEPKSCLPSGQFNFIVIWLSFMLEYFSQNGDRHRYIIKGIPTIPSMGNDAHRWVLNCHLDRHINLTQMVALHKGPKDAKGINTLATHTVQ